MLKLFDFAKRSTESALLVGAVLMIGAVFGTSANAISLDDDKINPVYLDYLNDVRNGEGYKWKLIPNMYMPKSRGDGYGADANLPSSYNLIEEDFATQLKNQGSDGICWAYALTTAMESNLLKTQGVSATFSAKQLDYLVANGTPYNNYVQSFLGEDAGHEIGGGYNFSYASFGLSSSSVPADETRFFAKMKANDSTLDGYASWGEYEDFRRMNLVFNEDVPAYTTPMNGVLVSGTESDYYVSDYTQFYASSANVNEIKTAVYNNGAVYVGTQAPGTPNCYDVASNTVVDRGKDVCGVEHGHAMAIVGWDDSHVYTDPSDGTSKTGAFIMQNSWGSDELFQNYGVTYERLVESGAVNPSELTDEQIQAIKDRIANYNAYEYVYLAYEFESSERDGATIDFATVGMTKNEYDFVSDVTNEVDGLGGVSEDGSSEIIYTYEAGETPERIEAIAMTMHMIFVDGDTAATIYVDNGNGYVEFGSITVPKNVSIKRTVVAEKNIDVSGVYKVKVVFENGESVGDYAPFFTTTVYANEAPADGGEDDGDGDNPGGSEGEDGGAEDDEDGEAIKVPNTGLFTGDFKGEYVLVSLAVVMLGASYVIHRIYVNRKSIFHKVKFDKKK